MGNVPSSKAVTWGYDPRTKRYEPKLQPVRPKKLLEGLGRYKSDNFNWFDNPLNSPRSPRRRSTNRKRT